MKLKQFELAFWCFEKCLDILRIVEAPHCDIALVINNLCDLLIEQFDDSCRALKHYEEILERECSSENSDVSTLLETLERVGKVHELQNNPEKAIKFFIQASLTCAERYATGDLQDEDYRRYLSKYLFMIGHCHLQVGNIKKAVKSFARAMRTDTDESKSNFHRPFAQELYKSSKDRIRGAPAA